MEKGHGMSRTAFFRRQFAVHLRGWVVAVALVVFVLFASVNIINVPLSVTRSDGSTIVVSEEIWRVAEQVSSASKMHWPRYAAKLIGIPFSGLLLWWFACQWERDARRRSGRCLFCGYRLHALTPHNVCPECGTGLH